MASRRTGRGWPGSPGVSACRVSRGSPRGDRLRGQRGTGDAGPWLPGWRRPVGCSGRMVLRLVDLAVVCCPLAGLCSLPSAPRAEGCPLSNLDAETNSLMSRSTLWLAGVETSLAIQQAANSCAQTTSRQRYRGGKTQECYANGAECRNSRRAGCKMHRWVDGD
jgi:hypothetical protein